MLGGTFGNPLAIPFDRVAPGYGQALLAVTEIDEPAGIVEGNVIEHELVLPVTIAPGTEEVHVYENAPGTGATLYVEIPFGQG